MNSNTNFETTQNFGQGQTYSGFGAADDPAEVDPFADAAEDYTADDTRRKSALEAWAESVLHLSETELERELLEAAERFNVGVPVLRRLINGRRTTNDGTAPGASNDHASDDGALFYGSDFKVTSRGVFAKRFDRAGDYEWDTITTTPIYLEAMTRDKLSENWGTYITIFNRDGDFKRIAIPHSLLAADKKTDIAANLATVGVGVRANPWARQMLVQFLMQAVSERVTSVGQIGWYLSLGTPVFVLPDLTLVPPGYSGAHPVLQTTSIQTQHGIKISGTVSDWIEKIARPLAGNSNIHLCIGTAFAGPLLYWANEPPGFFHLWGPSKIAKSLAAALGQSVWGRPKVPGEADSFGASWVATAVGLERFAILRSDLGAFFDEIGEGQAKAISAAIYSLANGSSKVRGTQDLTLRPMESFRVLGISTGEPTMVAFLTAAGEKVPAGMTVRLVDVPAEVRPESAFETCSVAEIEELGRRFYPLATQLHGAVGRAWLQHLVDLGPEGIRTRLREHREAWLALPAIAAMRAAATGQVRSVMNRFALVAAALRMAIGAGLLPWDVEDTDLGVAACMVRWAKTRKGRLDVAGEMIGAVEQIRSILVSSLQGRFIHIHVDEDEGRLEYVSPGDASKRDTLGFVKDGLILVEPTAWRQVLCAGFDPEKTARHLRGEGLLVADLGKLQKQEKVVRGAGTEKGRFYALTMRILEEASGNGPEEVSS
jgi:putative DNA primase/helicase